MKLDNYTSPKKLLWQLVFICLPLSVLIFFLLRTTSGYYAVLNKQYILQSIYFSIGLALSCIFHAKRLRFLPSFIALLILFWLSNKFLDNFAPGEFDSFFIALQFSLFTALFTFGWLCGWGISRVRIFPAILAVFLVVISIFLFAKTTTPDIKSIITAFAPVVIFAFYIIYMNELIRNASILNPNGWSRLAKHLLALSVFIALLFGITYGILRSDFKAIEEEWGSGEGNENTNGIMQQQADGSLKMKDKLPVQNRLNQGSSDDDNENRPLFVAYLNNFFPDSKTPNPLYFVTDYFTKFDDYTETFEPDSLMPFNDLFKPDLNNIPLYSSISDSAVLENGKSTIYRKVVDLEVYKVNTSPSEFSAPTTAFFCQPIAVEKELEGQFKSAYRAKSYVSELNSAYFVVSPSKKDYKFQQFQEHRFDRLRIISDFEDVDSSFLAYYTQMPKNKEYDTIKGLSHELTKEFNLPIDKILAIRDFFKSGDEEGKPLFRYDNNSGPVPPGSRLLNFLFTERSGYCAHFAGATLFLLRAAGIPSRLAIGYFLEDRSTKNEGWYWVYQKQAHAWVQVYLPEFGWLDFDTTYGDEEQREASQSDGTPPVQPNKAWYVGKGLVKYIDVEKKTVAFEMNEMLFHDTELKFEIPVNISLDMHVAKLYKDSLSIELNQLTEGDKGLAISFAQVFSDMPKATPHNLDSLLRNFPNPAPIDEFRVSTGQEKKEDEIKTEDHKNKQSTLTFTHIIIIGLSLLLLAILIVLLAPYILHKYYNSKANKVTDAQQEAYHIYRASMYLLNQMGIPRENLTPLQYSKNTVDSTFGTNFESFVLIYLKAKYAKQELSDDEKNTILSFYKPFEKQVKSKFTAKQRFGWFLNIYNTLNFFTQS